MHYMLFFFLSHTSELIFHFLSVPLNILFAIISKNKKKIDIKSLIKWCKLKKKSFLKSTIRIELNFFMEFMYSIDN